MEKSSGLRVGSILSRMVWHVALGAALIIIVIDCSRFDAFDLPSRTEIRQATVAVVFTGAFERIDTALELLDTGLVERAYISGVNGGAGILPSNFVRQFSARNPGISDLERLIECCIEWGEQAENTFQNARDTRCWVDRHELTGPLLLVTSRHHMARAKAALSGALLGKDVVPYPVDDATRWDGPTRVRAYFYYLATFVLARLPLGVGGERVYGAFAGPCPDTL